LLRHFEEAGRMPKAIIEQAGPQFSKRIVAWRAYDQAIKASHMFGADARGVIFRDRTIGYIGRAPPQDVPMPCTDPRGRLDAT
jgi:glycyl-tRNA synthetase alpha subunit